MSETASILVAEGQKKDNGWYEIKDNQDHVFSTKKADIGASAIALIGKEAKVTFTVKPNGDFVNRYIDAIEPVAASNGDTPALGTGDYVKGQTAPNDKRSIAASVALKASVDAVSHTIPSSATAREAAAKIIPLADELFLWLGGKAGVATNDDVPF